MRNRLYDGRGRRLEKEHEREVEDGADDADYETQARDDGGRLPPSFVVEIAVNMIVDKGLVGEVILRRA